MTGADPRASIVLLAPDLATLLVQEGLVAADAMERAVVRQRIGGGALDTAILELDLMEEASLVHALSRHAGLPPPPPPALADPNPRIRRVLPARVAERLGVAPFRIDGRDLTVLALYPPDLAAIGEVAQTLDVRISPHVAPEWRVRELAFRVYGTPPGERLARLAQASRTRAATGDPYAFDIDVVFELPPAPEVDDPPPGWSPSEARAAVEAARARDEIVRVALRAARDTFEWAALVSVARGRVSGHDAVGGPGARTRARRFARPLEDAGIVASAVATGAPQVHHATTGDPLVTALGRGSPHTVLLQPVRVRGRVVAVLYGDGGATPVSPARVRDQLVVWAAVGPALERLLVARKGAAGAPRD